MTHTPVLIIGAGPAGCSASFFLSKAGIRHTIIDKTAFPRDKVCGDAMSGKTEYVLRNADEAWLTELRESCPDTYATPGLSFVAPDGGTLAISFGKNKDGRSPGFTATRLFFDDFLFRKLDARHADILSNTTLSSLARKDGSWEAVLQIPGGERSISASLIIAADGDKGDTRKLLGLAEAFQAKTSAVGLRAYYQNVAMPAEGAGNIELHFLQGMLPGYFWIFPLPEGRANVGIGMLGGVVRARKLNLRNMMLEAIANEPTLRKRFKDAKLEGKILGWGLPMGTARRPASGEGYLLTGDAAALIDPFSGEGIGNALYSGMKAAQAAEAALAANDCSGDNLGALYDGPLYKRLWPELRISVLLQKLCRYPWLFNFMIGKARRSPELKAAITGMFTDLDLRDKLRQPGFYLRILMNR